MENIVPATCTENAKVAYVCVTCGTVDPDHNVVEVPDSMIDHDYDVELVPATCTEDGSITSTCKVCGDTEVEVLLATGHTPGESEYIPATCTENGKDVVKCAECGEILEENDVGDLDPAKGHTEEEIPAVPATCGTVGYTAGVKCSECGEVLTAPAEIPVDPANHADMTVSVLKPATCSKTGIGRYKCTSCGVSYYGTIEKLPHTLDEASAEITKEPTCTEAGVLTVTCSKCGAIEERSIEALGHEWGEEQASEDGTCVYKECARCHEIEVIEWIECPHENTEVQNAKDATCTEAGYTGDTICADCGETLESGEEIPALGHTEEVIESKDPTCTEAGLTEGKKCSVCDEVIVAQEEIPALGHAWDEGEVTLEATCTEDGEMSYTCTVCGETRTEAVAATGHTPAAAVVENEIPATATDDGSYESVVYCSVCGEELSREVIVVPAFGCEHLNTEIRNAKAATCAEPGYTGDTVCADCGELLSAGEEIPATGDHKWTIAGVGHYDDGTAYIIYKCSVCGAEHTVTSLD